MNWLRRPKWLLTPWRAWWLAVWLVSAQMLGLAHAVSHPQGLLSNEQFATATATADDPWHAGHTAGSVECQLLNQLLGHADALLTGPCAVPTLAPAGRPAPLPASAGWPSADRCNYQARAPPIG